MDPAFLFPSWRQRNRTSHKAWESKTLWSNEARISFCLSVQLPSFRVFLTPPSSLLLLSVCCLVYVFIICLGDLCFRRKSVVGGLEARCASELWKGVSPTPIFYSTSLPPTELLGVLFSLGMLPVLDLLHHHQCQYLDFLLPSPQPLQGSVTSLGQEFLCCCSPLPSMGLTVFSGQDHDFMTPGEERAQSALRPRRGSLRTG